MKNRSFLLALAAMTNLNLLAASEIKVGSIPQSPNPYPIKNYNKSK